MKTRNCKGFLLTLVIVAMALMGVIMAVLTQGANTMLFHADTAQMQAVQSNMIASGLAWARARIAAGNTPAGAEPVQLDATAFGARNATLAVSILQVQEKQAKVRIKTSCMKGRCTLNASRDYTMDLP
jgi:hypothetical protein